MYVKEEEKLTARTALEKSIKLWNRLTSGEEGILGKAKVYKAVGGTGADRYSCFLCDFVIQEGGLDDGMSRPSCRDLCPYALATGRNCEDDVSPYRQWRGTSDVNKRGIFAYKFVQELKQALENLSENPEPEVSVIEDISAELCRRDAFICKKCFKVFRVTTGNTRDRPFSCTRCYKGRLQWILR